MSASVEDNAWIETICTYRITCDNTELVMQLLEGKSTQTEIEAVLNEHGIVYEKTITEIDHTAPLPGIGRKAAKWGQFAGNCKRNGNHSRKV